MVLPASPSLEKEGTFTNTERRVQRLYEVFEPLGDSKPDWQIITDIANRLGADWRYEHPADIMEEAAMLSPLYAGVTYERLEGYNSLQWLRLQRTEPIHRFYLRTSSRFQTAKRFYIPFSGPSRKNLVKNMISM